MTTGLKVDYFPLNCAGGKYEVPLKLDKITFHSLKNCTVCRIPTAERLLPAFISNHPFIEKLWLSGIVFFLFCWIISKIKRFLEKSEKLLIRAARLFYGTAENTFSDFFFPLICVFFPLLVRQNIIRIGKFTELHYWSQLWSGVVTRDW